MLLSHIEFEDHELLSERALEFGDIVELTPLTDDDRATPWYRMLASLPIPSTPWEDRDDYIRRAYLRQAADHLVFQSVNSGLLRVYGAYPGKETLRMLPRVHFGLNRWWQNCVKSGRYHPMNTFQDGSDGEERERRSDYLLYVRDADWTQAIENMLDRRRQLTGSVLDPQWRELGFGSASEIGAARTSRALGLTPIADEIAPKHEPLGTVAWSEDMMADAIRSWVAATSIQDREVAWREHFKARRSEHGWKNTSFRDAWAVALGSVGKPGPRPNSAR